METPGPGAALPLTDPHSVPEEASGLTRVMWFGVLYLVGMAVGWAFALYVLGTFFATLSSVVPSPGPVTNSTFGPFPNSTIGPSANQTAGQAMVTIGPLFRSFSLFLPVSVVIELAALASLTMGFRKLGKVDRSRFSTPSTLMLVMIAGTFVAAAGALLLFSDLSSFITKASGALPVAQPAGDMAAVGSFLLYTVLVFVGAILTFVGLIGGLMLGLWRAGSRYDETLLKLAAIFVIIPFLNIVAPILVIVGAHGAKSRLSQPH